jgi:phosphoglycolate phosphatase-like HAD superfamily hydrolase
LQDWQAFFFDFDGVLADSVEVKTRAFAHLFEPYGPAVMTRVVEHHRCNSGVSRVDKFRYYYQEFLHRAIDDQEITALCQRFSRLVVDEVVAAPEIPGAKAFLDASAKRLPLFVVSAAPEEELREIVARRGWSQYFLEVTGTPKSKRENLAFLLQKYNFVPQDCVFFGDAIADFKAAASCGVCFLGIVPGADAPLLQAIPGISWVRDFTQPGLLVSLNLKS